MNNRDLIGFLLDTRDSLSIQINDIDGVLDVLTGSGTSNFPSRPVSGRGNYRASYNRNFGNRGSMGANYNRYDEDTGDVDAIGDIRNFSRHVTNKLDRIEGMISELPSVFNSGEGFSASGRNSSTGEQPIGDSSLTDEQLLDVLNSASRNSDDTIDLRTAEGRQLKAAGWVDDDGHQLVEVQDEGGGGSSRGSRSGGSRVRQKTGK